MPDFYTLNEDKTVSSCTSEEWYEQREKMFQTRTKHVAKKYIYDYLISTVWLGIDHAFTRFSESTINHEPMLFETMIFKRDDFPYECYLDHYSTWKEAEEGHKKAIEWVKNGCKDDGLINE